MSSCRSRRLVWAALPLAALITGCATKYLTFITYTKVGLDVSVADGTPTQAVFGYKRFEGAVVPVKVFSDPKTEPEPEAMSVYAAMDVTNGWTDLSVTQIFATGQAAVNAAGQPDAFANLVKSTEEKKEEAK